MGNLALYCIGQITIDGYIELEQSRIKAELRPWSNFAEYQKAIDHITILEHAID